MASGSVYHQKNPLLSAFLFLSKQYVKSGYLPSSDRTRAKLHLPYSSDDAEVSLEDYYGAAFRRRIEQLPKTILYQRSPSLNENTAREVRTLVVKCLRTLQGLTTEEHGCVELDFVQNLVVGRNRMLSDNDPSVNKKKLSVHEVETLTDPSVSKLEAFQLRMCLPEGENALLKVFESLGAIVIERKERSDKLICECFPTGFKNKGKTFGGTLDLDPTDLSFTSWCVSRYLPEIHILLNPRSKSKCSSTYFSDVRLKSLVKIKKKKRQLINTRDVTSRECPVVLTEPNLGGLLCRAATSGDGFQAKPNCGIREITETFNRVRYTIEMSDFKFILNVCDGVKYNTDRYSGKSVILQKIARWPKLKFPMLSAYTDQELKYSDMITTIVHAFMDAVGDGRVAPEVWETFVDSESGPVSSVRLQEVRRRVGNAETLEDALDVPANTPKDILSETVNKLLTDAKKKVVILPDRLMDKVKKMAQDREITVSTS